MHDSPTETTAKTTRRVRKEASQRAQEILDAACEVFRERGASGFNLRRVAQTVGVRLSTLQYHYPTREILLTRALNELLDELVLPLRGIAEDIRIEPAERLRTLCMVSISYFSEAETAQTIYDIFSLANHDDATREILLDQYRLFEESFVKVLHEMKPGCASVVVEEIAAYIVSQLQGLMIFVRRDLSALDGGQLVDRQVDHVIAISLALLGDTGACPESP